MIFIIIIINYLTIMIYNKVLFQYKSQLCCLIFNEITMYDLADKTSGIELDKDTFKNYIIKWLDTFINEDKQFETIQIIGCLDDTIESDNVSYWILIDESNNKLFHSTLPQATHEPDFNLFYNKFIETNNLWDGKDYPNVNKEQAYLTGIKKNFKQMKIYIKERVELINKRVELLNKIIGLVTNVEKLAYYKARKANQFVRKFQYNVPNSKKVMVEKMVCPIVVTRCDYKENKLSSSYSTREYFINWDILGKQPEPKLNYFSSYSFGSSHLPKKPTYKYFEMEPENKSSSAFLIHYRIVMRDDGHDYYQSHTHDPEVNYKFGSDIEFTEIYLKNLAK